MHWDLGEGEQQLIFDQIPEPDRFVADQQRIETLRQLSLFVRARGQRQQYVGVDLVIKRSHTALATQLQDRSHPATQHCSMLFIAIKSKPEHNIACRIEQQPTQPR